MFDWDRHNLRKIHGHRIGRAEVEQALAGDPIAIHEQDAAGEARFIYYGETLSGRLLAIVLTERGGKVRVVTAYDLDAGQKRDYLRMRAEEGWRQ